MTRIAATLLVAAVVLSACQTSKEDTMDLQQRAEERAVITRGYVDDLAQQLGGADVQVAQDTLTPCDTANPNSGLSHAYVVRFAVGPDASQFLLGPVAEQMEADGWTIRRDAPNRAVISVRFLRGTFSIGAKISEKTGNATAGGSGGCVEP